MKWLLLSCFLLWARHGEGGALKCSPDDDRCLELLSEDLEQQEIDIRRPQGSSDAPAECLSGSEWESNCHRCRCLDGEAQCLRQPGCESIDEPIRCAPNSTFERECNTCVCLESGLGLCTVDPCELVPRQAPSKPELPQGVECAPGTTWTSQCNDCVCSPDGHPRCTEKACPGRETEPVLTCAPQSQWKQDCNTCSCLTGRYAACTLIGCPPSDWRSTTEAPVPTKPQLPQGVECAPGTTWQSQCNDCVCSPDGYRKCTEKLCPGRETEPVMKCAHQSRWMNECNNCWCHSGHPACTLMGCEGPANWWLSTTEEPAPTKPTVVRGEECAPGTTWESECFDCQCSPAGHPRCTKKACPGRETEAPLSCAPQSQWKRDCNMCWCNSGRAVCTKMGCLGIPVEDFDMEEDSDSEEVDEPNKLPKVPDVSNDILETDTNDQKHSEKLEDLGTTPEDLTEVNLKELADFDRNDIGPNEIPNEVNIELAVNVETESPNEKEPQDESNQNTQEQTEEDIESKNNNEEQGEDKENKNKDVEELDTSYFNSNNQHAHRLHKRSDSYKEHAEDLQKTSDSYNEHTHSLQKRSAFYNEDAHSLQKGSVSYNEHAHSLQKRSACKPSQEFQNECNTCKCSANGESYTCTQNECMDRDKEEVDKEVEVFMENEGTDHIERHSVCKPSSTFYVNCNTCHCNAEGSDFSCTNKPCPLPADVEVFHELHIVKSAKNATKKVCVENRMFIMNCNTCWCNEDGTSYFCTRKVCVQDSEPAVEDRKHEQSLRVIQRDCKPDEVFEVECNMCRCNADGKSFSCTRRACVDADSKNQTISRKTRATPQDKKNCQPGQEFRLDCNKCLCDNEGENFSCTRIDCAALNNNNNGARRRRDVSQNVSSDCAPGSVFDQGCNVCRCTEDGGHATCSTKRCPSKNNSTPPGQESGFRCNPGEQFKRSCNDCSCSADGKSVFCTLRLCDDELTP